MTGSKNPYKAYTRASHTVAKTRQVVMLYDGVIRFLQQARVGMETGDINERFSKLVKAGDVIVGLQSCLDFESGGATAQVLYDFYSATEMRILTLHRTSDLEECDAIIRDLKQMRDVWYDIDRGMNAETTPAEEASAHEQAMDAAAVAAASLTVSV